MEKASLNWALFYLGTRERDIYAWNGKEYEFISPEMSVSDFVKRYVLIEHPFYVKK